MKKMILVIAAIMLVGAFAFALQTFNEAVLVQTDDAHALQVVNTNGDSTFNVNTENNTGIFAPSIGGQKDTIIAGRGTTCSFACEQVSKIDMVDSSDHFYCAGAYDKSYMTQYACDYTSTERNCVCVNMTQ